MNSITGELSFIAVRTRRMIYGSTIVHAILLAWLLVHHTVAAESEGLTEITWVEVAPVAPPEPAAPPVAREETRAAPVQEVAQRPSRPEPEKVFKRELKRAAREPVPQKQNVSEDVISSRLSSLTRNATETDTRVSQLVQPPKVGTPSLAGVSAEQPNASAPSDLQRQTTSSRPAPVELSRTKSMPTQTAAVVVPTMVPDNDSPRAATLDASSPRRNLAGAQLAGPVADRELLSHVTPVYPEWAKREAVEGSVTLYFLVLPDGRVKENVLVDKTSGFGDFDENAVEALLQWRFAPAKGAGEQWGKITFHFRLTDG